MPNTIFPMRFVKQKDSKNDSNETDYNLNREKQTLQTQKRAASDVNFDKSTISDPPTPKHQKLNDMTSIKVFNCTKNDVATPSVSKLPKRPPSDVHCRKIVLNKAERVRLENLVLRQRNEESAISIINSSVDFCRCSHEYVFEDFPESEDAPRYKCSLYINGVLVGKAYAEDKKSAKHASAGSALMSLRTTQPTILVSSMPGDLDAALSRNDIISGPAGRYDQKIEDSNLGNQLLRKMGWKGEGGLGKSGSGISAPITVSETYGRAGLGIDASDREFISFKDAHDVISNYAESQSTEELTFSPELTNEERAKIHKLSRRYGLRSKSYNKGLIRYMVVSRKLSAAALVDELQSSGGSKGNIQLIGPGHL